MALDTDPPKCPQRLCSLFGSDRRQQGGDGAFPVLGHEPQPQRREVDQDPSSPLDLEPLPVEQVQRPQDDIELLRSASHAHDGASRFVPNQVTEDVVEIEVFNRGSTLFMTDDEKMKRIHRVLYKLDRG